MNFHKTIGFLATLLLILGLGVPNVVQAQSAVKSVGLSSSKTSFKDTDNATAVTLTATVTLAENAPNEGQTVVVTLADSTATSVKANMQAESGDYSLDPNILNGSTTISVTIAAGSKTGSGQKVFTIDPATDDSPDTADEVLAIGGGTGSGNAKRTDVVKLTIEDTDNGVVSVGLSSSKTSFKDTDNATAVTLTATVTLEEDVKANAGQTVVVTLVDSTATSVKANMQAESGDYSLDPNILNGSTTISVTIPKGSNTSTGQITFTIDPATDDSPDTADEVLAIGGSEASGQTDVVKLTIEDTDNGVVSVGLSSSKTSFKDTDNATAVTLTATVTLEENVATSTPVVVTLVDSTATSVKANMQAEGDDYSLNPNDILDGSTTISVTIAAGSKTGSGQIVFNIDPATDDSPDTADEVLAIGGSEPSGQTDVVKLTIEDTDNGVVSVGLSSSKTSFKDTDNATAVTLTATVTLEEDVKANAGQTVVVTLVDSTATSVKANMQAESGDYSLNPNILNGSTTISVTIPKGSNTSTGQIVFTIDPATDDSPDTADEVLAIGGSEPSGQTDVVKLTITDADTDAGAVTSVEFSPATLSVAEGASLATTVTVTVNVAAGVATTYDVALTSSTALPLGTINSLATVSVAQGATSGMVALPLNYTAAEDENTADETITITGTVGGKSDMLTLTVADNDAGAVTSVEFSPATLSVAEGASLAEIVTVTVNVAAGAATTHTVTLSSSLPTNSIPTSVTVLVAQGATSGTAQVPINYTSPSDGNLDDETITVTGTTGGQSGTLTLNVDDTTVSKGAITITTSISEIREDIGARNVTVTATLTNPAPAAVTVAINAVLIGDSPIPTSPVTTSISIAAGITNGSVTIQLNPSDDDILTNRKIQVTGSASEDGYVSGSLDIPVIDDDISIGTLTITAASPPSINEGSGATTVTLTVKGTLKDKKEDEGTVIATLTTTAGTFPDGNKLTIVMKDHVDLIPDDDAPDGTAKIKLALSPEDVKTAGTRITVTASADLYDSGSRVISIRDRDAIDVQGYRLALVKPAAGGWANENNDQVIVDLIRVGSVAYPWTDFDNIKVSVRDTAHDNSKPHFEINQVTASNFNREDNGSITFDESGDRGDVIWRGNDTIRFEIRIKRCDGAVIAEDKCGDYPSVKGQFLGAYVVADFTVGSTVSSLSNKDSEKPVYPSNPTLIDEANRYVGDGKLFKVDNLDPSNEAISSVNVTVLNAKGERVSTVKVGDEVHVAVKVSGDKLFRENGLRIQLQPRDGKWKVKGQALDSDANDSAPVTKTVNFNVAQIIASVSDSLRTSWKITEGLFKFKTDDYIEGIGPKGVTFEADNTEARVLVAIKDQAGNWSSSKSSSPSWFKADSRSPKVRIRYPAADPDSIFDHTYPMRFTGGIEGDNVHEEHLNPLRIEVDEDLSKLQVFAVGSDTLDLSRQFSSGRIADSTATYNTSALNSPKKKDGVWIPSSKNIGGTEIDLVVLATDNLGNVTRRTIDNVIHDAAPPEIKDWFPKNSLLQDDQFNDKTPPVFTLREDVDSIAVRFMSHSPSVKDATQVRGGLTSKGEDSIDFSGKLQDEIRYTMTIYVRDLAGNVFITPPDSSSNMRFNAEFDNPVATGYKIEAARDSVIAGQANILTIQAEDQDANSNTTRNALTYKNKARISAWDASGGAAESVWFEGTGVDDDADNPDGEAMLSASDWRIGKRTVTVKSNKALNHLKILVQHLDSGMGDTAVVGFHDDIDSLYVGAADFAAFEITAEDDVEGIIWGDYTLRVVPTDRYGNPSVRAFQKDPAGSDFTSDDSLAVLDTRMSANNVFEYKKGIDVEIAGVPSIEDFLLLVLTIAPGGSEFDLVAPADRRKQTVQVRVSLSHLLKDDTITRNRDIRSSVQFIISKPLTPTLSVWDSEGNDVTGQDVVIPADGDATVTVAAEGYNAGDMVTFTRNDTAMDPVAANDDGVAKLDITASMAGTTTVSATDGRYSTDALTITFVDTPPEPDRKSYVDANGDPVYLIYTGDAPPDMTVGTDDFLALVAAFGSSDGNDNYNAQADVNDDGTVNVADYLEFLKSYGKTAAGPATKPLVLLPGINENAEFSLSLGSERVVAGELVAVDVSLANVEALTGYGFALNYETDKFEFVSAAPADEDLLKSTGGETLFHHVVADGQITVANGLYNGTAISGGGDVVRFVFRVLREFEDNARFEIADGLVFDPSQLQNPAVVAGVLELQSTPREFALHQNFPNPFNPDTTIKYDLAESADVTLQIYNVLGQVVRTLVASEAQNAGRYQIRWNGMDDRGVPVSSGIYFYQISADGKFSDVRKLMLLK